MDFKIQRCITFYEKNKEQYQGDYVLLEEDFSLEELKTIFGNHADDPLLYNQYDIKIDISKVLCQKIDFEFDFDNYDYFFETFNVNPNTELGNGIRLKQN